MPVSAPSGIKITDLRGTINILVKSTGVKTGKWAELNRADICPDKKTIGESTPVNLRVFVGSSDTGYQFLKVCLDEERGKQRSSLVARLSGSAAAINFKYFDGDFVSIEPPPEPKPLRADWAAPTAVSCAYEDMLDNTEQLQNTNGVRLDGPIPLRYSGATFYQATFEALQKLVEITKLVCATKLR